MVTIARADRVERDELLEFVRPRHRFTLITRRRDGGLQVSPVAGGVDAEGRLVVSTYPDRAKAANLRRDPAATVLVHSDDWNDPYVQVEGTAEVVDMPEAAEALVDYYRSIAGEHPDWDDYREAMRKQGKSLIRITVQDWGPVANGGFPPDRAPA
ncbi:MAG: PPOX class F420-dependent oxidoreductase [Nocardioidaceae bacterium]|nr:PPOX class F420-dependent oxidoreductase [Nocardioidaceae bacterium]MCL2613888.1 PPOX class F420-dependent oxidoreductase [Nocardioidaceae bacterium]